MIRGTAVTVRHDYDVVIIGVGVAGGAMATRLARNGHAVLVLERTRVHVDRIRGEFLAPWGVREARELGLLNVLLDAGGHFISRTVRYEGSIPIEAARASAMETTALVPDVPGAMMLGHPRMCVALDQAAQDAGATLLRGVDSVSVEPGLPPTVSYVHENERYTIRPRLVVGADGRGSSVARQIGAKVQTEPVHHLIAGLLIEGVHAWPEDEQAMGVHDGALLLIFPQGQGRIRLYLCYSLEERGRFAGPQAANNFLQAFRVPSLPFSDAIAGGQLAGPCQGYPNADTWIDEPIAPGVVLIGDASGHNDPTIGQGLSITMRDVRLVSDAISTADDWHDGLFADYASERRERMRRLRLTARLTSKLRCEFDVAADMRRTEVWGRIARDRSVALPLLVPFIGPFGVPDETFEDAAVKKLLGDQRSLSEDGWCQYASASGEVQTDSGIGQTGGR
jgi:menaquinone-9 beta-reductase